MEWLWTAFLALGMLVFLAFLQAQESSLYTVHLEDVVGEEQKRGRSTQTGALKRLLKRRMILINFILFLIFLCSMISTVVLKMLRNPTILARAIIVRISSWEEEGLRGS